MHQVTDRRGILGAGLALGVALVAPGARACEFFTESFTIIHPWTRASADGATSAIVCMSFQDVAKTDRLIGVQTPVAESAEWFAEGAARAVDVEIRAGQTTVLAEKGEHLRLVRLRHPMVVGRQYPMTLVFAHAGPVQAQLTVDYARFA